MPWGFDSIQFSVKLPQDPWKIQFDLGIIPNFSLIIVAACEFLDHFKQLVWKEFTCVFL